MQDSWIAERTNAFDSSGIRKVFDLAAKMKEVNEAKNLANATPAQSIIEGWVTAAKATEPKISH